MVNMKIFKGSLALKICYMISCVVIKGSDFNQIYVNGDIPVDFIFFWI